MGTFLSAMGKKSRGMGKKFRDAGSPDCDAGLRIRGAGLTPFGTGLTPCGAGLRIRRMGTLEGGMGFSPFHMGKTSRVIRDQSHEPRDSPPGTRHASHPRQHQATVPIPAALVASITCEAKPRFSLGKATFVAGPVAITLGGGTDPFVGK